MATAQIATAPPPDEFIRRITVEQYRQMSDVGILTEDDQVELLEGWIVEKMGKNQPHIISVRKINRLLLELLPEGWFVDSEQPIDTSDSEPEPDFAVIRGGIDDDPVNIITADSVGLVIEVANTTLVRDRGLKVRIYARAGIAAYWIVNLTDRQIEVYTQPYTESGMSGYRQRSIFKKGQAVSLMLDGLEIAQIDPEKMLP